MPSLTDQLARRAAERAVAERQADYAREMDRIVDATFSLIERTGNLNPPLRDVLAESGLSTQAFYRYFRSKDELLLVLLDVGRRRLMEYLSHRMARTAAPEGKVRQWVLGVMAQAGEPQAAGRTKPFAVDEGRIAEAFPVEHRQSVDLLVGLLTAPVTSLLRRGGGPVPEDLVRGATLAVYDLSFAALRRHLMAGTAPSAREGGQLVGFVLGGIGALAGDPGGAADGPEGGR